MGFVVGRWARFFCAATAGACAVEAVGPRLGGAVVAALAVAGIVAVWRELGEAADDVDEHEPE